jgi:nicotinamidase-related amidase
VITAEDEARYAAAGFGRPAGSGTRPALLIIDVQYRTVGDEPKPFFDSVREHYPTSCGEAGWAAVANIAPLLAAFRERSLPVLYPHVAPKQAYDAGRLAAKVPSIMDIPDRGYRFVEEVAPADGDILIPKRHPSASYLIDLAVDWLVVTGCTTSGCVRASVVDGFAYNFRITVPHDAVYDRSPTVHAVNLFDMAQKYADVTTAADVIGALPDAPAR